MASLTRPSMLRQGCKLLAGRTASSAFRRVKPAALSRKPLRSNSITSLFRSSRFSLTPIAPAAFHNSAAHKILPPLPQRIQGTINDAASVPAPSPTHGSYHWTFERLISVALIPLTIAPFAAGSLSPVIDATLCFTIIVHSHIGFQSMIIDYIPSKRLPRTRKFFWWGLRAATLGVAVGLYEFETNDVGLTEAIKRTWRA